MTFSPFCGTLNGERQSDSKLRTSSSSSFRSRGPGAERPPKLCHEESSLHTGITSGLRKGEGSRPVSLPLARGKLDAGYHLGRCCYHPYKEGKRGRVAQVPQVQPISLYPLPSQGWNLQRKEGQVVLGLQKRRLPWELEDCLLGGLQRKLGDEGEHLEACGGKLRIQREMGITTWVGMEAFVVLQKRAFTSCV